MVTVNITELRRHLPGYLKQVEAGNEICVTSRGKIVARIVPEKDVAELARSWLEGLHGQVILGDVVSPVENVAWGADDDHL